MPCAANAYQNVSHDYEAHESEVLGLSVYLSERCPRPQQVRIDQWGRCTALNSICSSSSYNSYTLSKCKNLSFQEFLFSILQFSIEKMIKKVKSKTDFQNRKPVFKIENRFSVFKPKTGFRLTSLILIVFCGLFPDAIKLLID